MGIISWMGEDEPDLERGEGEEDGGAEDSKRAKPRGRLEKGESTETQDTRLTCVDDQPDNPLDAGLFTVTPRKMEDGKGDRNDVLGVPKMIHWTLEHLTHYPQGSWRGRG